MTPQQESSVYEDMRSAQKERRLQSWVLGLGTLLFSTGITYIATQIHLQGETLAVTVYQMARVNTDMYRADDAKRDVASMTSRLDTNTHRIDMLENRLNVLDIHIDRIERSPKLKLQ